MKKQLFLILGILVFLSFPMFSQVTYYINKVYPYTCSGDRKAVTFNWESRIMIDERERLVMIQMLPERTWLKESYEIKSKETFGKNSYMYDLVSYETGLKWRLLRSISQGYTKFDLSQVPFQSGEVDCPDFEFGRPYKIEKMGNYYKGNIQ